MAKFTKAGKRCTTVGCADYAPTFHKLECSRRVHVFEAAMILRAVGRDFPAFDIFGDGVRGG
jgi:hypothetical protein